MKGRANETVEKLLLDECRRPNRFLFLFDLLVPYLLILLLIGGLWFLQEYYAASYLAS